MKIIRAVLFLPLALLRLILVLLVSAVTAYTGLIGLKLFGFSRRLQGNVLRLWGRSMMVICGIRATCNKIPGKQHLMVMTNHRSYLDIAVLAALYPASFVAKSEVQAWPVMKAAARLTGIIFVSRSELKSLLSTINRIKNTIGKGIPVVLFPEGTTYRGPLTKPFKKGSFKIAAGLSIPVLPAAIHYEDEDDAWTGDDTFAGHFLLQMGKPITRVHLRFGEAQADTDASELLQKVQEEINTLLSEIISDIARKDVPA